MAEKASAVGSIRTVYILHGWTYSMDKWKELTEKLRQTGVVPVMLPVPGLTAASEEVWDLNKYVDWLYQATSNERQPFVLIGHSNGGRIGLAFSIRYPNRVSQLILIDSAGVYHNEPLLRLKRGLFATAAKVGKRLSSSDKIRKALYRLARAHDYEQASPAMRQTMINLSESDKQLNLGQVTTPTVIIWGEQDSVTPLEDGQLMATQIPRSELKVVRGARHSPFYTHSDEVAHLIEEVLK